MRRFINNCIFFLLLAMVGSSCIGFQNTNRYKMDFGSLAAGDTVWMVKKTFKGYAVLKDTTVSFGGCFKADSSSLKKLKIVSTLISL